jgi:hypothetical protein
MKQAVAEMTARRRVPQKYHIMGGRVEGLVMDGKRVELITDGGT